MQHTARPLDEEVPEWYRGYRAAIPGDDLLHVLTASSVELRRVLARVDPALEDHAYAPGKWTIKEVLQHIIDAERVFAYRALRFARNDRTDLPGYDENAWSPEARVARRHLSDLLAEHDAQRASTITLFASFDAGMLMRLGTANKRVFSVRALGWIIAGHAAHHVRIVDERYLS